MKFQSSFIYLTLLLVIHKVSPRRVPNAEQLKELKEEIFQQIISPEDDVTRLDVKTKLADYLVETTLSDYLKINRLSRQDDDGEGGEEQQQTINGVRRILQNVFAGNLVGIIQESVSIRSPGRVQEFFADVLGALFGSKAVQGAGSIGLQALNATANNATTPVAAGQVGVQPIGAAGLAPINGIAPLSPIAGTSGLVGPLTINPGVNQGLLGNGLNGNINTANNNVYKNTNSGDSEDEIDENDDL